MLDVIKLRQEYVNLISSDIESNRLGALRLKDNMAKSPLYVGDSFRSFTVQIPRLVTEKEEALFKDIVDKAYSIFDKVIKEYLNYEDYRELFPFDKRLEELILTPCGYDLSVPVARFDIFYHEDSGEFYFCEINTDGTSGMNEDMIQDKLYIDNVAHQEMIRKYRYSTYELFDSFIDTFIDTYNTYDNKVNKPNIAIVDFLDKATIREFEEFTRRFQKKGYNCEICDIRNLIYKDKVLYSDKGHKIDAIYRRAVTVDIMSRLDEVEDFISAVKNKACFIAGSFKTQIIHHKYLFYILHLERTKRFLTDDECDFIDAHIPFTIPLDDDHIDIDEVLNNQNLYIIKPDDNYGSSGVYAGVECDKKDWVRKVNASYNTGSIIQRYAPQYVHKNIDFAFGDGKWHDYINMSGLFAYGGKFAGIFAREAVSGGIIASHRNERTQPTYIVRER